MPKKDRPMGRSREKEAESSRFIQGISPKGAENLLVVVAQLDAMGFHRSFDSSQITVGFPRCVDPLASMTRNAFGENDPLKSGGPLFSRHWSLSLCFCYGQRDQAQRERQKAKTDGQVCLHRAPQKHKGGVLTEKALGGQGLFARSQGVIPARRYRCPFHGPWPSDGHTPIRSRHSDPGFPGPSCRRWP